MPGGLVTVIILNSKSLEYFWDYAIRYATYYLYESLNQRRIKPPSNLQPNLTVYLLAHDPVFDSICL